MKRKLSLILSLLLLFVSLNAQQRSRISLQVNYGAVGNFFVRSYDEDGGPQNKTYLYKKNFIGSIAGLEATFHTSDKAGIFIGFSRSVNTGVKNYFGTIGNVAVEVTDFKLRHNNNFFQLGYSRKIDLSKSAFKADAGLVIITDAQQLISIENWDQYVEIDERNNKNSNLVEGGVFLGLGYNFKIDTKFDFGIRMRGYFLISTGTFEAVSLTPTLKYVF